MIMRSIRLNLHRLTWPRKFHWSYFAGVGIAIWIFSRCSFGTLNMVGVVRDFVILFVWGVFGRFFIVEVGGARLVGVAGVGRLHSFPDVCRRDRLRVVHHCWGHPYSWLLLSGSQIPLRSFESFLL